MHHGPLPSLVARFSQQVLHLQHICIVGAGPAGFYTASQILKRFNGIIKIDMLVRRTISLSFCLQLLTHPLLHVYQCIKDRLPTPFGLVRSGVAPDHPDTKNVTRQFTSIGSDPRVSYYGNVQLGRDISLAELRAMYDSVVLSYGAEGDRKLGIDGEKEAVAKGELFSSRMFSWWYTGHPDAAQLGVGELLRSGRVKSVAICGAGNVALDCARILLRGAEGLRRTDAASHAIDSLAASESGAAGGVREVHLVARRGSAQAQFTPKELKELVSDLGIRVIAHEDQMKLSKEDQAALLSSRVKRRVHEIISKAAASPGGAAGGLSEDGGAAGGLSEDGGKKRDGERSVNFQFFRRPESVKFDSSGRVEGLVVEKTVLRQEEGGRGGGEAVGTGEMEVIPAQLILVSIGFKSLQEDPSLPFDHKRGVIPNIRGRVIEDPQDVSGGQKKSPGGGGGGGLYCCGWLKRGPTGIIGTNLTDAEETVTTIIEDMEEGFRPGSSSASGSSSDHEGSEDARRGGEGLEMLLRERGVRWVTFGEWIQLDEAEVAAGEREGRPRSKITSLDSMLAELDS